MPNVSIRSSVSNDSSSANSLTVNAPAGVTTGDWMIAIVSWNTECVVSDDNGSTPFTKVTTHSTTGEQTLAVFSRKWVSGDPATFTFVMDGAATRVSIVIFAVQDGDQTDIFDVPPSASTLAESSPSYVSSWDCPDLTTTVDNTLHVAYAAMDTAASSFNSFPSGYTAIEHIYPYETLAVYYIAVATAGAVGAQTFGTSGSNWTIAQSFSLQGPAASADVTGTFSDKHGDAQASLSSLSWAWFDEDVGSLNAPTATGSAGATDGSGAFTLDMTGTALTSGQTGTLVIYDSTGSKYGAYRAVVGANGTVRLDSPVDTGSYYFDTQTAVITGPVITAWNPEGGKYDGQTGTTIVGTGFGT